MRIRDIDSKATAAGRSRKLLMRGIATSGMPTPINPVAAPAATRLTP